MIALSKIKALAINFSCEDFNMVCPPNAVKNSDGNVEMPKQNIPAAANNGLEIAPAIKNAPYKRPQGMNPRIIPRK